MRLAVSLRGGSKDLPGCSGIDPERQFSFDRADPNGVERDRIGHRVTMNETLDRECESAWKPIRGPTSVPIDTDMARFDPKLPFSP